MKLTDQQISLLSQKFSSLKLPVCPTCQGNNWTLTTTIFELREFQGGSFVIGGQTTVLPVIPLTCSSCGLVLFFNAINLGIIENKGGNETEQK